MRDVLRTRILAATALSALAAATLYGAAHGSPPAGSSATASPFRAQRVLETGPSRGITGFTVLFNRRPSRASAERIGNYRLYGYRPGGQRVRIALDEADREGRRVRVRTENPFGQAQFERLEMRVRDGRTGLRDRNGVRLDGNRNGRPGGTAVFRFRLIVGTTVNFTDHDGDRASLTVRDGGRLDGITPIGGPRTQRTQFWILDPIARMTKMSGSVTRVASTDARAAASNGIVVIAEISGLDGIILDEFNSNMSFRVITRTTPSNATGIG